MNEPAPIDRRDQGFHAQRSPAVDQRRHPRYLTFRTGKIIGEACNIDCAVLDISVAGARLLAPKGTEIPTDFTLVIDPENSRFDCRLAWNDGLMAGVAFKQATLPRLAVWLLENSGDGEDVPSDEPVSEADQSPSGWSVKPTDHRIGKDNRRFTRLLPTGPMSNAGAIVVDPEKPAIPCTIVDVSASGVCLEASAGTAVPETFALIYGGVTKPCRVIWTEGRRIGASFAVRTGHSSSR